MDQLVSAQCAYLCSPACCEALEAALRHIQMILQLCTALEDITQKIGNYKKFSSVCADAYERPSTAKRECVR
jgi:hypothetical protein